LRWPTAQATLAFGRRPVADRVRGDGIVATASVYQTPQPAPGADRNAFLVFVALVWLAILSGFGTDSYSHVLKHGLDYPLIVHLHAVTFVGFAVLFTTQVALIRTGRPDLHRRLGVLGAVMAAAMLVIGPATALTVDAQAYAATGHTPEFLAVQFTDICAFAVLAGSGLLLRRRADWHRRLMLMALFYISDAGFARFLNDRLAGSLDESHGLGKFISLYGGSDLLLLAFGAYDLATRRRLHPAWLAGVVVFGIFQFTAIQGLHSPAWKAVSMHLIGR
jgi:uncharacterized membrane protein YozB (DUF420 family)